MIASMALKEFLQKHWSSVQSLVNERTRQRAVSIRYVHPEERWWVAMMTLLKLSWWASPVIPTVKVEGTYLSLQLHFSRTGVLLLPNTVVSYACTQMPLFVTHW